MLTHSRFLCPACGIEERQRIVFVGSEFSYECPACLSVHCFAENLYWDFTDNFRKHGCSPPGWELNRYIGTFDMKESWISREGEVSRLLPRNGDPIISRADSLRKAFETLLKHPGAEGSAEVSVFKLSGKNPGDMFFVSNAVTNQHFQECFRAVVRMKEHLLSEESKSSYNILIMDEKMDACLHPPSKLDGLDEVWKVVWTRRHSVWHVSERPDEFHDASALGNTISLMLDRLDGLGMAISKRGGPCRQGTQILRDLLHADGVDVKTMSGDPLDKLHVGILVRPDRIDRIGFSSPAQLGEVCGFVRDFGLDPVLVSCSDEEGRMCRASGEPFTMLKTLREQAFFYENMCLGVIGTNCSGCNLPCLYGLPLLSFAKDRPFPDDFYCMGRMLSPYDCTKLFCGDLFKPDSVVEVRVPPDRPFSIMHHLEEAELWIRSLLKKSLPD